MVRAAERDGKYYIDLVDERRHAVKITADGWTVLQNLSRLTCGALGST
jgi:hypothetical protein